MNNRIAGIPDDVQGKYLSAQTALQNLLLNGLRTHIVNFDSIKTIK